MGRKKNIKRKSNTILRLEKDIQNTLSSNWRKVWVQFVEFKKRTPLCFTFFPHKGQYEMEFFELKPAIVGIDGIDEITEKEEIAYGKMKDKVINFLIEKGYIDGNDR